MGINFDLLAFLNELINLGQLKRHYSDFSDTNPTVAAFITVPFVFVISYAIFSHLYEFIKRLRCWVTNWKGITFLLLFTFGALMISFFIVYAARLSLQEKPTLHSPPVVIAKKILLKWKYEKSNKDKPIKYQIQSSSDAQFSKDNKLEEPFADSNIFKITRNINATRFWRVRAIRPREEVQSIGNLPYDEISPWSDAIPIAQYESVFSRIKKTGKVNVIVSSAIDQGNFIFQQTNGNITGFEVELIKHVVKELSKQLIETKEREEDLNVVITTIPWVDILNAPSKGEADMIISSITNIPDREKVFGLKFSKSYYTSRQALLFRSDTTVPNISKMIKGKRIGVMSSTTSIELAKILNETTVNEKFKIFEYSQTVDAIQDLLDVPSPIDFVITDFPAALGAKIEYSAKGKSRLSYLKFTDSDFSQAVPPHLKKEKFAIAIRRGEQDLLEKINVALHHLDEKGITQRLCAESIREFSQTKNISLSNRDEITCSAIS